MTSFNAFFFLSSFLRPLFRSLSLDSFQLCSVTLSCHCYSSWFLKLRDFSIVCFHCVYLYLYLYKHTHQHIYNVYAIFPLSSFLVFHFRRMLQSLDMPKVIFVHLFSSLHAGRLFCLFPSASVGLFRFGNGSWFVDKHLFCVCVFFLNLPLAVGPKLLNFGKLQSAH